MKLWQKNIIAIIFGSIVGMIFKEQVSQLRVIGELFINIVKMISVPLIFFILVKTITSFYGKGNIKQLISRAVTTFAVTGLLAILIADTVALLMLDDKSANLTISSSIAPLSMNEIITHVFPTSFLVPFLEDRMIQIVLLAVFVAYTLMSMPNPPKKLLKLISEITDMLLRMLELIIQLAPYAIFAYAAWLSGSLSMDIITKFSRFFYIILISYTLILLLLGAYIGLIAKINPFKFFAKSFEYQVFAFSTGSSKASLSFTIIQAINQLGMSPSKANLLIPLGASINMTGLAAYLSSSAIFLANFYNIELDLAKYMIILIISFVSPIGAAGLSGGALLVMPILLSSVGIPFEALVLMTAIDPIINGIRTAINITGDVGVALIIDKQDNELNESIYNQ